MVSVRFSFAFSLSFFVMIGVTPCAAAQSAGDRLGTPEADAPDVEAPTDETTGPRQGLDRPRLLPRAGQLIGLGDRVVPPRQHSATWLVLGGAMLAGAIGSGVAAIHFAEFSCGGTPCSTDVAVALYGALSGALTVASAVFFVLAGIQWADVDAYNDSLALDANGIGVRW